MDQANMEVEPRPLPVPADAALTPEASRHLPTLMAGTAAGSQGQVRVWYPEVNVLRQKAIQLSVVWLSAIAFRTWLVFHNQSASLASMVSLLVVFWMPGLLATAWRAVRRPQCLATDDAGIAITNRYGKVMLRWEEIKSLSFQQGDLWHTPRVVLESQPAGSTVIPLDGFRNETRLRLLDMLLSHANLEQDPATPYVYRPRQVRASLQEETIQPVPVLTQADEGEVSSAG